MKTSLFATKWDYQQRCLLKGMASGWRGEISAIAITSDIRLEEKRRSEKNRQEERRNDKYILRNSLATIIRVEQKRLEGIVGRNFITVLVEINTFSPRISVGKIDREVPAVCSRSTSIFRGTERGYFRVSHPPIRFSLQLSLTTSLSLILYFSFAATVSSFLSPTTHIQILLSELPEKFQWFPSYRGHYAWPGRRVPASDVRDRFTSLKSNSLGKHGWFCYEDRFILWNRAERTREARWSVRPTEGSRRRFRKDANSYVESYDNESVNVGKATPRTIQCPLIGSLSVSFFEISRILTSVSENDN